MAHARRRRRGRGARAASRGRKPTGTTTAPTGPASSTPRARSFPGGERTTYTAAAVVLAADALSRTTDASGLFRGEDVPAFIDTSDPVTD